MRPVIAVPARNEEARLPRLISALSRQTVLACLSAPLPVILALNNTTDRSRAVAREAVKQAGDALRLIIVEARFATPRAHAGSARRLATERAAREPSCDVMLTTDADAEPADDWVESNLRAIHEGADIVGGRIMADPREEDRLGQAFQARARAYARYAALRDELAALLDPLPWDPWPRHHDHTGASLAVRADVYRAVGGLDPLALREDVAFVAKVRSAGFRLRHAPDVAVTVSARTRGRARGGMADCLRGWVTAEERGEPLLVECPAAIEERLLRRRVLRELQGASPLAVRQRLRAMGIAGRGGGRAASCIAIPALIERFAADDLDAAGTVPVGRAIAILQRRIDQLRESAHAA